MTEQLHFHFSLSCIGEGNGNPPVFLPGESQGRGSLVGCCLWGHTGLDTTEATQQQQQQQIPHSLNLTSFLCLTSSFSPQITFCAGHAKFFTFLQFTILFLKSPPLHILFPLPPTSDNFPFNFQEPAKIASLL